MPILRVTRKPVFGVASQVSHKPGCTEAPKMARHQDNMSRIVRKAAFCICENKDADQLRSNREADQRLCFRYTDRTIPLLPKSEISNLLPSCVAVQDGLCRTWSETPKTGFLRTRLICPCVLYPLTPHFYIVKLGFTGVYIIFLFLL